MSIYPDSDVTVQSEKRSEDGCPSNYTMVFIHLTLISYTYLYFYSIKNCSFLTVAKQDFILPTCRFTLSINGPVIITVYGTTKVDDVVMSETVAKPENENPSSKSILNVIKNHSKFIVSTIAIGFFSYIVNYYISNYQITEQIFGVVVTFSDDVNQNWIKELQNYIVNEIDTPTNKWSKENAADNKINI